MFGFREVTEKCIELTLKNAGVRVDILVVDDGSPESFYYGYEPSEEYDIRTLRIHENSGFTNAVNQGILWAQKMGYEYVHLLNNDTEPEPDFIKTLIELMEKETVVGIASSSRVIESEGKKFIENFAIDLISGYQMCTETDIPEEVVYADWLPLCSALIRMEMIRYIGLLDRRMRNHCSDNDYCIRANMNGWNVALVPKSRVMHYQGLTTEKQKADPALDQKILFEKMAGYKYSDLMKRLPLDHKTKTFGRSQFMTYQESKIKE